MKTKILFFAICNLLICFASGELLFSQNITNTLGTNGLFKIKGESSDYLTLSQSTGFLSLTKSLNIPNTTNSTIGVIYKNDERFIHDYQPPGVNGQNTFIGTNSGNFTMLGTGSASSYNTAVGHTSLASLTSGSNNSAFGYTALIYNTSGAGNSAFGSRSLFSNTTGNYNSAFGLTALYSNTTGNYNTAFGYQSLSNNSTGNQNSAYGNASLCFNETGSQNSAFGLGSLFSSTSGSYNCAFGFNSMASNSNGSENTAFGFQSLFSNSVSSGNTAVGYNSLYSTTGWQNTAVGHHSLNNNTSGNYNTAIGYNSGSLVTTGYNLTLIGIDANPTSPTANDQITLGNQFVSSLRCNVQNITSLSDARDKKNVQELSLGLDFITKLKPRQFNWDKREWYDDNIPDGSKMKEASTAGFIAQELDSLQTTAGAEWLNLVLKDNPEKLEATYGNLLPVMVKAIQELKAENENEIAKLKAENDELRKNNDKLSAEMELIDEKFKQLQQFVIEQASVENNLLTDKK